MLRKYAIILATLAGACTALPHSPDTEIVASPPLSMPAAQPTTQEALDLLRDAVEAYGVTAQENDIGNIKKIETRLINGRSYIVQIANVNEEDARVQSSGKQDTLFLRITEGTTVYEILDTGINLTIDKGSILDTTTGTRQTLTEQPDIQTILARKYAQSLADLVVGE